MSMNEILIVTRKYPHEGSTVNVFLANLAEEFSRMGKRITVISPDSVSERFMRRYTPQPRKRIYNAGGEDIRVFCPRYISFSSRKICGINFGRITVYLFKRAVLRECRRIKIKPDAVYGHFIDPAGICAAYIGKKLSVPSYFAYGESSPSIHKHLGNEYVAEKIKDINGIIAVSSDNKRILINEKLAPADKIEVFPNGADDKLFYSRNKDEMREKLSLPRDKFIVSFVGHFIERKGPLRLLEAINGIEGNIGALFMGKGEQEPKGERVLFAGALPHDKIPEYISASDVFVLPTLAEGCCNAIVEALCCATPVISSDLPFNEDILSEDNSILCDPQSTESIKNAIEEIYKNEEKSEHLRKGAAESAKRLTVSVRAERILSFMEMRKGIDQ